MKDNENNTKKSVLDIRKKKSIERLNFILEDLGLENINQFSEKMGYTRPEKLYKVMRGENAISKNLAKEINSKFPQYSEEWLLTGEGNMLAGIPLVHSFPNIPQGELKPKEYSTSIKVRLVSNKAKAGWSEGYYNEEYLEELPFVMIDSDENYKGKYLAFEVEGDSMEPDYLEGDIVICREIQRHLWGSKLHYKDWDFVIAHSTNGIMLKEITAHNVETGDITCHSLNPKYEDFVLNLHQVAHLYNVVEIRQKGRNKRWNRAKDFM